MDEYFVGRVSELAALDALACRVAAGSSQIVVVVGQAGIGKTALVRGFLSGWEIAARWVSGDVDETSLPGGLLDQIARSAGPAPSAACPAVEDVGSDPLRAGSALLAIVRSWERPAALVIDDAQWGDDLSLRALSYALRRLRDEALLTVFVVRADEYAGLPPGLIRVINDKAAKLEIPGFGISDVQALAERVGSACMSARAARRLLEHTGGVPLHLWEVLHALPRENLCAALSAPDAVLPAPKSLEARVLSRLAECSACARHLVAAAAVLGGRCRLADAAELAGLPGHLALPAMQEAVEHGLLAEAETIDGRCCEFPHASIRAAVYRDIGVSRRAVLHRSAAALTAGAGALAHRVAACPGADPELAGDLTRQAREEAAAGKLAEASGHYLAAVRVAERGPERDRLLRAAVHLMIDLGNAARSGEFTQEVMAMPPSAGRSLLLGRLAALSRDHAAAQRWLADAWSPGPVLAGVVGAPDTGDAADSPHGAAAACELALLLLARHELAAASGWARRAAALTTDGIARACAHVVLASCLALAGHPDEALALLRGELGTGASDDPGQPLLQAGLGTILLWCDDVPAAIRYLGAAADARPALPLPHLLDCSLQKVLADYRMGAWDDAVARAARLITLAQDLDQGWLLASAHAAAVYPSAARGEWHAAQAHADAAVRQLAEGSGDRILEVVNARAALAYARDNPDGVLAAVRPVAADLDGYAVAEPAVLGCWPLYAHALARTGRLAEASRVIEPFEELARSRRRRSAIAAASRVRAFIHAAAHRHDDARAAYETAIAALDGLGMPHEEALARLDYGRFLRHNGQRRAASRELCAARATFAGLRAAPFVDRCDAELGEGVPALGPLTARQLAVAQAVAAGKSNQEVARDLYITVKTVEYHVSQILARLGVDARTEIAAALPGRKPWPAVTGASGRS
jgi:DNA-binding CsgD family transcriptional regulator